MNICICFGPSWEKYIPTQVYAICESNKRAEKINFYLVTDSRSKIENEIRKICNDYGRSYNLISISNFYRNKMNSRVNVDTRFTRFTLYRLAIPNLIEQDRILYLDADTLVVGDLSSFYNMNLDGYYAAGCQDTGIGEPHKVKLGLNANDDYINAGVILFDLAKIKQDQAHKDWISLSNKKHFPAHDQDIINLTLRDKIKIVGPEYNCAVCTSLDVENPVIYHFSGVKDKKNWILNLPNAGKWVEWQSKYDNFMTFGATAPANKIQKLIAYGWFGGNPKPEKIQYCIDSWKRVAPDYEILELNESNCDVNCNEFVKTAYESKKYAFVADYFRMKAMYDLGCVTLDADVELLKPLDPFLKHRGFSGQEVEGKILITATMGFEKGHPLVKMIMDYYDVASFDVSKMKPNTGFISELFKMFIATKQAGKIVLEGDVHLYPKEFFCNYDHKNRRVLKSSRSFAIHHFQGSWVK
jgi:lipopolysaccharide biosynthesis glycosyltransferase